MGLREEQTIIRAGHNSRIGRLINRKSVIGTKLGKTDYLTVMTGLMELLAREGLVSGVDIEADHKVGVYRLQQFVSFLAKLSGKTQRRATAISMNSTMRSPPI